MRQQWCKNCFSNKVLFGGEKRTHIHLTGLDKGICLPLPFQSFPANGRKDTHVTTPIKQERMWSADKTLRNFWMWEFMLARSLSGRDYPDRPLQTWKHSKLRGNGYNEEEEALNTGGLQHKQQDGLMRQQPRPIPFQASKEFGGRSQQASFKYQRQTLVKIQ